MAITAETLRAELPVEFISANEAAKYFHTTPAILRGAIENGTLPIGFVSGSRCVVVKNRVKAYVQSMDMLGQLNLTQGIRMSKQRNKGGDNL